MATREPHSKGKKLHLSRKIGAIFLILFTLLVLLIFCCYYWQKITNREKLAAFLPADSTVAFLEFNLSGSRPDAQELLQLVENNPLINQFIDSTTALVPNQDVFQKWYNGKGGLAILTIANQQSFQPVIFLGRKDDAYTADWIKSLMLDPNSDAVLDENYYGQKLISYKSGQSLHLLWTNDYLAIADNQQVLESIAQTAAHQQDSLRSQPDYNQLSAALPEQNLGFMYLNRSKLLEVLTKNDQFLSGRLSLFKLYFPFLNMLSTEAVTFRLESPQGQNPFLEMQHLSLYNKEKGNGAGGPFPFTEVDYFYSGQLEKLLPQGAIVQAGGVNLLDQRNKMQAYFQDSSGLNDLLFSGLLSSFQNLLSSSREKADLDNNFFPVFQKEYLFYLCNAHEKPAPTEKHLHWGLILDSDYPDSDLLKIKKILLAIGPKLAAELLAKPVPMTLPDGTIGTEIKAELSEPVSQIVNISGKRVEQLSLAPEFNIYLWADPENKLLVVANSDDDLKQIFENQSQKDATVIDYDLNRPSEAYYIDFQELTHNYPAFKSLEPLNYLKAARKYTSVGMLSTYQLGF